MYFIIPDDDSFKTGTTATVCLLHNSSELVVGHVGDSIAILCREGQPVKLSIDHDPEDCEESVRIIRKGRNSVITRGHFCLFCILYLCSLS